MRDDGGGHPLALFRRLIGSDELFAVVAVHDFDDIPPERLELFGQRRAVHDFLRCARDLQPVEIDGRAQVVQAILRRRHHRLIIAALLHLAVAEDDIGAVNSLVHLRRKRHADAYRKPVPQRTAVHLHAGDGGIRMPDKAALKALEGVKVLVKLEIPLLP